MSNTPSENLITVEAREVAPWVRRTVLTQLNPEAITKAFSILKSKVDPKNHGDVHEAWNKKLASYGDRVYTEAFAQTINPLEQALQEAIKGETGRLVKVLGLANITRVDSKTYAIKQDGVVAVERTAAMEQQSEAVRAQAEAARKAQADAEAARVAKEQAQQNLRASGRLGAIRDFLGGTQWAQESPTVVAKK
jgi:hypothetical protein